MALMPRFCFWSSILPWTLHFTISAATEGAEKIIGHSRWCPITQEMLEQLQTVTNPCKANITIVDYGDIKYTTGQFLHDLFDFQRYLEAEWPMKKPQPFKHYFLTRKKIFHAIEELQTMKYILSCPAATFGGTIAYFIWHVLRMKEEVAGLVTDPSGWDSIFGIYDGLHRCLKIFFDAVNTSRTEGRPPHVLAGLVSDVPLVYQLVDKLSFQVKSLGTYMKKAMKEDWADFFEAKNKNDTKVEAQNYEQFLIMIREAFNHFLRDNVIDFWTISEGSLVASMRYGEMSSLLPSGIIDHANRRLGESNDIDVYVEIAELNFFVFASGLEKRLRKKGCGFCGFQEGYEQNALICHCPPFQLDLRQIPKKTWSLAIKPLSKCVLENVELPCPGDAHQFLTFIWGVNGMYPTRPWLECLHLPPEKKYEITKEDVRFIWKRTQELHSKGYQNFARYFSHACELHSMGEFAHSLFLDLHASGTAI